eukprot:UN24170
MGSNDISDTTSNGDFDWIKDKFKKKKADWSKCHFCVTRDWSKRVYQAFEEELGVDFAYDYTRYTSVAKVVRYYRQHCNEMWKRRFNRMALTKSKKYISVRFPHELSVSG